MRNHRLQALLKGRQQKVVAAEAGVSESMLSCIMSGKRMPSARVIARLAEALKVRITALYEALGIAP